MPNCFVPAKILLPHEGIPLNPWACIAVDQFTSQPEYWQQAEKLAEGKASTLHMVLPEAYLGTEQEAQRLASIRETMQAYRAGVLTREIRGYVYLERTQMDGTVRQGLVGAVDLETYSYHPEERLDIRPSEATVVSRIPPRLAVRRGAVLETPHVMMLADDEECTLIEPIGREKDALPLLYEGELMLGGGYLRGWAVQTPELIDRINRAVSALGGRERFAARWHTDPAAPTMTLAVGDGNHSLATAKAYWEEIKKTLSPQQQKNHPARWCLAEVCNVHSPAIEIEGIHRVLFGTTAAQTAEAFGRWLAAHSTHLQAAEQRFTLSDHTGEREIVVSSPPAPLTVGTVEQFIGDYLAQNSSVRVDYIHGADAARSLASDPQKPAAAVILPDFEKSDLFRGVVLGGVLPRKTFSMGHAEEKRYYNECRSLVD